MKRVNIFRISTLAIIVFTNFFLLAPNYKQLQAAPNDLPEFRVVVVGTTRVYSNYTSIDSTHWIVDDSFLKANLSKIGLNQWQLDLTPKQNVTQTIFPWMSSRWPLDSDISDDIFYYPLQFGTTEKDTNRNADGSFFEATYPGDSFAPLIVNADSNDGEIVAATNWPPKTVVPSYGGQRMILQYNETVPAGSTASYGAIIARVSGNTASGQVPWQLAVDQYKDWLRSKMGRPVFPDWQWQGEGSLSIWLHTGITDINYINSVWNEVKSIYPLTFIWGQMDAGGCCSTSYTMNSALIPALPNWVKGLVSQGYHVGYYSAPNWNNQGAYALDNSTGLNWLTGWVAANKGYGANAFYMDTLGRTYWDKPDVIRNLFNSGTLPKDTVIEGAIDVYNVGGLISGTLNGLTFYGTANWICGAPYKNPENYNITTFQRFGRYILPDHILYNGGANGDGIFWGNGSWVLQDAQCGYVAYCAANGPCDHGMERASFLMGTKLEEVHHFYMGQPNPIRDQIASEHQRVNWWNRRPTYFDTKDLILTSIPPSSKVEVTHFKDLNNVDLFAVSNPLQKTGLSFTFNGQSFAIPTQKIAIIDTGTSSSPTLKGDLNHDGIVNSLDWSIMNNKWFSNDTTADLNNDGIVNSLDFSIMNGNWSKN